MTPVETRSFPCSSNKSSLPPVKTLVDTMDAGKSKHQQMDISNETNTTDNSRAQEVCPSDNAPASDNGSIGSSGSSHRHHNTATSPSFSIASDLNSQSQPRPTTNASTMEGPRENPPTCQGTCRSENLYPPQIGCFSWEDRHRMGGSHFQLRRDGS